MDDRHWDSLDRKVEHLDIQYSTLSSRMSGIETSIKSLTEAVGKLTDKANQPQKTEWQAILAGLALVFSMAAAYANLSISPIKDALLSAEARSDIVHDNISSILMSRTDILGKAMSDLEHYGDDIDRVERKTHDHESRISKMEGLLLGLTGRN